MPTTPGSHHGPPLDDRPAPLPVERPTARVILLDPADRVLLLRVRDERTGELFWCPPGGGVEAGESAYEAAARELREETGLTTVTLGPELWRRERLRPYQGTSRLFRERHFLGRLSHGTQDTFDTSGLTAEERALIVEHRWWTLPALTATTDRLAPLELADRLAHVLRHGPPDAPWHLDT